jgi:hypothetical protein
MSSTFFLKRQAPEAVENGWAQFWPSLIVAQFG